MRPMRSKRGSSWLRCLLGARRKSSPPPTYRSAREPWPSRSMAFSAEAGAGPRRPAAVHLLRTWPLIRSAISTPALNRTDMACFAWRAGASQTCCCTVGRRISPGLPAAASSRERSPGNQYRAPCGTPRHCTGDMSFWRRSTLLWQVACLWTRKTGMSQPHSNAPKRMPQSGTSSVARWTAHGSVALRFQAFGRGRCWTPRSSWLRGWHSGGTRDSWSAPLAKPGTCFPGSRPTAGPCSGAGHAVPS